jgi:bifunctional non-homologous end joining protein LigD
MPARKTDHLARYRAKRHADRTPEPFGSAPASGGRLFVVQMHAARVTHYDFRLEMEGVLRSWAVPRGPSPNPADKRLAVYVEDHPLEYARFEGRIPEGNYGAGAVIVWDRGTWAPLEDPLEGLEKGKLLFDLHGHKLRGRWTLVRTKRGPKDWLLIKERDAYASTASTDAYPADSVVSGLTVEALASGDDPGAPIAAQIAELGAPVRTVDPAKVKPMLAETGEPFSKLGWLFEIKYDGYRLIVARSGGRAVLYSRAGHDLTETFPEIASAVAGLPYEHVVLDGEVVVHDARGLPSFARLQKRGRLTRRADIARAALDLPATYYAFDLLGFGDRDLRGLPLHARKEVLRRVLPTVGSVRYSEHIEGEGLQMYEHMRGLGLEGVLAKRADSKYAAGRSGQWLKIAIARTDDFVVVGYTELKGSQAGFGALLLAQYAGETLVYVGRAGSGFTTDDLRVLRARLEGVRAAKPPRNAPVEAGAHWTEPAFVCEVRFKEVTPDGLLRQPVFVRVRDDKPMEECVRRQAAEALPEPAPVVGPAVEKHVHYTNLDKVFWPAEKYTKGDLIAYYRAVSKWLLPYLQDRPLVLTRYPDGIDGKSFFQKDAPGFAPEWIRTHVLWSEQAQREVRYFVAEDEESLAYIINMGTIPLHVWSSRLATLERPDWCIIDLDPKGAPFADVLRIAKCIEKLCADIALPCLPKTSGSTGLHVLIPLGRALTYEQSRTLGELIARVVVAELSDIATIARAVPSRGGKVYVDYLQNGHGRLLVAPFSVRPLARAPVSMPLAWREVKRGLANDRFTIANAVARLEKLGADPLRPVLDLTPDLGAALERLAPRVARGS